MVKLETSVLVLFCFDFWLTKTFSKSPYFHFNVVDLFDRDAIGDDCDVDDCRVAVGGRRERLQRRQASASVQPPADPAAQTGTQGLAHREEAGEVVHLLGVQGRQRVQVQW